MSDDTQEAVSPDQFMASLTVEQLTAGNPELIKAIQAEAAKEERERCAEIIGLQDDCAHDHSSLITELVADPTCSVGNAARKILKAEKAAGQSVTAKLRKAEEDLPETDARNPNPLGESESEDSAHDPGDPEACAKAEWGKDADLRTEFGGDFDRYFAWYKREKGDA